MKTKEDIERKIKSLVEEMDELTDERNDKKERFGGISKEENDDYFLDISAKICQVDILKWVIS